MPKPILIAAALVAACLGGSAAQADEVQNQIVAAAKATSAASYSFRRTMVIQQTGQPGKKLVEQYDPRRREADQWALVSVDGRTPTAKETADAHKAKRGPVPSYGELAKWVGAPASRTNPGPGYALYRFASLPAGTLKIGSHDASADTQAEVLVNIREKIPVVERVRLKSTKGFRMMLVASIDSMMIDQRYRLLPDGHAVPSQAISDMSGSMLGKAGRLQAEATYSDFQAAR
ncbi:MAG: hypothetical protein ABI240_12110 [Sphingomonas sp.]